MVSFSWRVLLFSLLSAVASAATPPSVFNIRDYGAVGDGLHPDTAAINQAVTACVQAGGGTVYLPPGRYFTGTIILQSNVTFDLDAGAVLLASDNRTDYPLVEDPWESTAKLIAPLIWAVDAQNITLTGLGTFEGQGQWWWPLDHGGVARGSEPGTPQPPRGGARPQFVRLLRCQNVRIEHLTFHNSPSWNIHPLLCTDVRIEGVTISSPARSANTDGINPESCRNVEITQCRIDTGDDCVTLKSGIDELGRKLGRPDENIAISNCVMLHGHGGVTIGSEMSGGVRNVVVSNCVFQGTDNGIRIKSQRGRGGVVEGIVATGLVMQDVPHPFTITTFYMGKDKPGDVFPVNAGTPAYRGFLFSDISVRGAQDAGGITGLREAPITNITFTNVHIQSQTGFTCANAANITFHDVVIDTAKGPALILRDSTGIDFRGLAIEEQRGKRPLVDFGIPVAPLAPSPLSPRVPAPPPPFYTHK
jgi:polygalacturonase